MIRSPDEYARQLGYIHDEIASAISIFQNTLPNLIYWVSRPPSEIDEMEYLGHAVGNIKLLTDATNNMKSTLADFRKQIEEKGYPGIVVDDIDNLEGMAYMLNKLAIRLKEPKKEVDNNDKTDKQRRPTKHS